MVNNKEKPEAIMRKLVAHKNPRSLASEQYRTLRTNINFSIPDKDISTILVTSASQSEGKSTTSANLAIVFAQDGKKVLLLDADMRKPTMHHTFSVNNIVGLSHLLIRQCALKQALKATKINNLDLITSGPIPPNPAELLGSKSMLLLMEQLKEIYDVIIVDAPPILAVADSIILANECDGTILVISSGKTEKARALKAKEAIIASNSKLIGAVVNNCKMSKDKYNYQYYNS